MTAGCTDRLRRGALALVAWPLLATAQPPASLEAHFEFLRNGSVQGEAETTHRVTGSGWRLENVSRGTQGSARLLGFSEQSSSEGEWRDGTPLPAQFRMAVRVATIDREWSAEFDWPAGTVSTIHEDGESVLDLSPVTLDPLAAGLFIRAGLAREEDHWRFALVDGDELDDAEFRAFAEERLDTALGCLVTRRVEKVRAPDSKRYTRTWYAKDHGWAPVRVEHGKTGGNHMETRILSLSVDGRPVSPGPTCEGG